MMLTESSKTWKKKASSSTKIADVPARNLEKHERILEVIDRVGRETVILCKKKPQIQVRILSFPKHLYTFILLAKSLSFHINR